jgi:hypothetical protein
VSRKIRTSCRKEGERASVDAAWSANIGTV